MKKLTAIQVLQSTFNFVVCFKSNPLFIKLRVDRTEIYDEMIRLHKTFVFIHSEDKANNVITISFHPIE